VGVWKDHQILRKIRHDSTLAAPIVKQAQSANRSKPDNNPARTQKKLEADQSHSRMEALQPCLVQGAAALNPVGDPGLWTAFIWPQGLLMQGPQSVQDASRIFRAMPQLHRDSEIFSRYRTGWGDRAVARSWRGAIDIGQSPRSGRRERRPQLVIGRGRRGLCTGGTRCVLAIDPEWGDPAAAPRMDAPALGACRPGSAPAAVPRENTDAPAARRMPPQMPAFRGVGRGTALLWRVYIHVAEARLLLQGGGILQGA